MTGVIVTIPRGYKESGQSVEENHTTTDQCSRDGEVGGVRDTLGNVCCASRCGALDMS